jgi:DNA adenine methylase
MKPIIKWSGGKSDEIKKFEKYIPNEMNYYIEPFVGGGSLYFHLNPQRAVINDIHKELIQFYKSIARGYIGNIYEFMKTHPNDEKTYYYVRDEMPINSALDIAMRFYYQRKTCFRGMLRYNASGKFNIPFGKYKKINYEDLRNPGYANLLSRTKIHNAHFAKIFKKYNDKNNFVFLDPPYDSDFTDYGYCSFDREEHKILSECFHSTENRCLMIIGDTDFIRSLYDEYIIDEYEKKYRFKIHSGRVGSEINNTHLVISNY